MKPKSIHRNDAILLLEDKQPHHLKVWKLSTGDIIEYKEATCIGAVNTVLQEIRGVIRIVVNIEAGCAKVRSHDLSHIDKVSVRVIINVHTSDRLHGMMVGIAA